MAAHYCGTSFPMNSSHVDFQEVLRLEHSLALVTLVGNFLLELNIVISRFHFVASVDSLFIEVESTDCKKSHAFCAVSKVCFVSIQQKVVKIWFILDLFSECYSVRLSDINDEAILLILRVETAAHARGKLDVTFMQFKFLD